LSLQGLLADWRNHLGIREWLPEGMPRLLQNGLPSFTRYEYETADYLRAALSLPGLSRQEQMRLLLPAVAKHLNQFGARRLYLLAEVLAEMLPAETVRDVLTWGLDKTENHFDHHKRPLSPLAAPAQIETAPASLAHFFWSLYGHIDKRVRWRALHAARFILKQPNESLLCELMSLARAETAGAFRSANPKLEFYWMSARSWLMLLLQRLAEEQPNLLLEHLRVIAAHALDKEFSHTQIRELARRTVLRVIETFPDALPQSVIQQIRQANQPSSCLFPRRSIYEIERHGNGRSNREEAERGFSFDLDTIPYWFDPLSLCCTRFRRRPIRMISISTSK